MKKTTTILFLLAALALKAQLPVERTFSTSPAQMLNVRDVAMNSSSEYIMLDVGNRAIKKFSSSGQYIATLRTGTSYPDGMAVDTHDRIIILENVNGLYGFTVLSPTGSQLFRVEGNGSGRGQFNGPLGISTGHNGLIYVADTQNHRIQVFSPDGTLRNEFGTLGTGPGQMNRPYDVHVDEAGYVFVADFGNRRINKYSPNYVPMPEFNAPQFGPPTSVTTTSAFGPVYATYAGQNIVAKLTNTTGAFMGSYSGQNTVAGPLLYPEDVTLDRNGYLLIADTQNHRFVRIDPNLILVNYSSPLPADMGLPWNVVIDGSDNIYIQDAANGRIVKFDASGAFVKNFGPDILEGRLIFSYGMAMGPDGNIYVGHSPNIVKVFSPDGNFLRKFPVRQTPYGIAVATEGRVFVNFGLEIGVYSLAGDFLFKFGSMGSGDGQFVHCRGITIANQNLYVADQENHRIQIFDLNGNFIRKFGVRGPAPGQLDRPRAVHVLNDTIFVVDAQRLQTFDSQGTPLQPLHPAVDSYGFALNSSGSKIVLTSIQERNAVVLTYRQSKTIHTITFGPLPEKTYGDEPFALAAVSTSTASILYSVDNPQIASISKDILTIHAAGQVTIKAFFENDPESEVFQTLVIDKAPLTIRSNDKTITYGDDHLLEFTMTYEGFKGSDDPFVLDNPPVVAPLFPPMEFGTHFLNAGSYPLTFGMGASEPSDNNYEFTLVPGTLVVTKATLTATADDQSMTLGDPLPPFSITYSGFKGSAEPCPGCMSNLDDISSIDLLPVASTVANAESPAGTYPITAQGGADNNYSFAYVDGTLTITGTPPRISVMDPADGAENITADVLVTAKAQSGATNYTIQLSTVPNFTSDVIQLSSSAREILFTGLSYGTTYYTRAKTDLLNLYGEITSFTTTRLSYVINPANDAPNISTAPTLTVLSTGARSYVLQLSTTSDFNAGVMEFTGKKTEFVVDGLALETRYYARVSTDLTPGIWGETRAFTTGNIISMAYLIDPGEGATGVPTRLKATANEIPGASIYHLELNPSADFTGISIFESAGKGTFNIRDLLSGTRYFARVSTDLSTEYGPVTSFTTVDESGARIASAMGSGEGMQAYSVSPNPFRTAFRLTITGPQDDIREYTLFDLRGRELSTGTIQNNQTIDLGESLSTGVYVLKLRSRNMEIRTIRVIKL